MVVCILLLGLVLGSDLATQSEVPPLVLRSLYTRCGNCVPCDDRRVLYAQEDGLKTRLIREDSVHLCKGSWNSDPSP